MRLGRWISAGLVPAAIAVAAPRASDAQPSVPATVPSGPLSPQQNLRQYIDRLSNNLGQGTPAQRDDAAQRLLSIGSFEARSIVTRILTGNDERAQAACAAAIADGPTVDPRWLQPLVQLLSRDRTAESAARALTRYEADPRAYQALVKLAQSRQQPNRTGIIRTLGAVVEKPVAEALVGLIGDPTEDAGVRVAAAEALEELSGESHNGVDAQRWAAWWNARKGRAPAEWRIGVLAEQHPLLEYNANHARDQLRQFKNSVRDLLLNQYTRQPAAEKGKTLLAFLTDPNPEVRDIGASIVPEAVGRGQPITDDIHGRLIELVGDASPDVRLRAIQALIKLADPNALDAMLTQLQVENDEELKIWLLKALDVPGVGNTRALGIVESMLNDPSYRVAAEAAGVIQALAPFIQADANQARQTFDTLRGVLQNRTGPPGQPIDVAGGADLRAALIGAMSKLASGSAPAVMDDFPRILGQGESPRTRRAALHGLAALGENFGAGDVITHELDTDVEPDPTVRQAAASALGEIGSFIYAKQLDASSRPQTEPDRQVRDSAWKAFQTLLPSPSTSTRELSQWADLFGRRKEPDRQVVVLKELCRKLQAANDLQNLAIERQRAGEVYLQLNQPAEAVPYLRQALAYWETNHANPLTVINLVQEMLSAFLQSNQYRDAVKFGEQEIRRDPSNQQEVGPAIRNAVERLVQKGEPASYKDAATLIQEALGMTPPLDDTYREQLQTLRQRLPVITTNPS